LEPDDLASIFDASRPGPAPPLPASERATFPEDDGDDAPPPGGYRGCQLQAVFEVPEGARLAALIPGVRGIVLFAAARGDTRHDIAAVLGITVDDVDDQVNGGDGQHVCRPER